VDEALDGWHSGGGTPLDPLIATIQNAPSCSCATTALLHFIINTSSLAQLAHVRMAMHAGRSILSHRVEGEALLPSFPGENNLLTPSCRKVQPTSTRRWHMSITTPWNPQRNGACTPQLWQATQVKSRVIRVLLLAPNSSSCFYARPHTEPRTPNPLGVPKDTCSSHVDAARL
jgi:hypothetical protein